MEREEASAWSILFLRVGLCRFIAPITGERFLFDGFGKEARSGRRNLAPFLTGFSSGSGSLFVLNQSPGAGLSGSG